MLLATGESKMDSIVTEIDKVLETLISPDKLKNYEKWKREYKDRIFDAVRPYRTESFPPKNTQPPGFERHLICYLFQELKDKDPHCEWNCKSFVEGSKQSVDIVFIQHLCVHDNITECRPWKMLKPQA